MLLDVTVKKLYSDSIIPHLDNDGNFILKANECIKIPAGQAREVGTGISFITDFKKDVHDSVRETFKIRIQVINNIEFCLEKNGIVISDIYYDEMDEIKILIYNLNRFGVLNIEKGDCIAKAFVQYFPEYDLNFEEISDK